MIPPREPVIETLPQACQPFDMLLDQFTEKIQSNNNEDIEAFLCAHPGQEQQLRQMLPTMRAMAEIGAPEKDDKRSPATDRDNANLAGGKALGDFRLVREIGRGGMGVVYEAEQLSLPRRVALKVLPFAAILDKRQLQRFQTEARAAATLDHPSIVSVYSVGCDRGVHYYAMQLIEGQTLAQVIGQLRHLTDLEQPVERKQSGAVSQRTSDLATGGFAPSSQSATGDDVTTADPEAPLPEASQAAETPPVPQAAISTDRSTNGPRSFRTVANLGIQAAEALDHAHANGVLHRDIKPGNLMLDAEGKLWITDFGLARIEADPGMTMTGDIVGTLRYMSPEQALAKRVVMDHRVDIYSLGITLYEMLTLEPALKGEGRAELLKQIAFEEPPPPCRINKAIPRDLETIVLKAIAKNPNGRYATAQELADDLRRFLEDKPIRARRVGRPERAWRWLKRNPIVSGLIATVLLLAISVAIVSSIGYAKTVAALAQASIERDTATTARHEAQQERDEALNNLYVAQIRLAQDDWQHGEAYRLFNLLGEHLPQPDRKDRRGWEWYYLLALPFQDELTFRDPRGYTIRSVDWSPKGQLVASVVWSVERKGVRDVVVWSPKSGAVAHTLPPLAQEVSGRESLEFVSWNPDGRRLAGVSLRGTIWTWDGEAERLRKLVEAPETGRLNASWRPDGQAIAAGDGNNVGVWDATTGERLQTLRGHNTDVQRVAWSPDGESIAASGYEPGWITIWNVASGEHTQTLKSAEQNYIRMFAWSPDSQRIATSGLDATTKIWHVESGQELLSIDHPAPPRSVAWSPDNQRIATSDSSSRVTVWNSTTGQPELHRQGSQTGGINCVAWSPDAARLATAAADGTVKVWNVLRDPNLLPLATDAYSGLAWSSDDKLLTYGTIDKDVIICNAVTGEQLGQLKGYDALELESLCWSPTGELIACAGDDGSIRVWDADTGEVLRTWTHEGMQAPVSTDTYRSVCISWHPNGWQLASVSEKEPTVRIWDVRSGSEVDSFDASAKSDMKRPFLFGVAWSPDGERLATASRSEIQIWDAADWRKLHAGRCGTNLAWSPDGRFIAGGASDGDVIYVVDTLSGHSSLAMEGQTGGVKSLAWDDTGRRIMSCSVSGCRIWDATTGDQLLEFKSRGSAAWSHDRNRIATMSEGKIRIHDASAGYEMAKDPAFRRQVVRANSAEAFRLAENGNCQKALQKLETALALAPQDTTVQYRAAWLLTTFSDETYRDADRALQLARKASKSLPESTGVWQVLGWAQYRKGNWQASIDALDRSVALQKGGDPWQWFFLAMAHWQLGHEEESRRWFDRSVQWLHEHNDTREEGVRFRAEAAKLLQKSVTPAPDNKQAPAPARGRPPRES